MAAKIFRLKVIACDKVFYEGGAEILTIPAEDGLMQIMADHESMVIAITNGAMSFRREDGETVNALTGTGFVCVAGGEVTMLSQYIERPEEIDVIRAGEARERAEERLMQHQSKLEYYQSKASLARAMARMAYKTRFTDK